MSTTGIKIAETQQIKHNFTYHPPKVEQVEKYNDIRNRMKLLALFINETCPSSRERSLAITALENAVFWANAAIARNT